MADHVTAEGGTPMADREKNEQVFDRDHLTDEQRARIEAVFDRIERDIADLRRGIIPGADQ